MPARPAGPHQAGGAAKGEAVCVAASWTLTRSCVALGDFVRVPCCPAVVARLRKQAARMGRRKGGRGRGKGSGKLMMMMAAVAATATALLLLLGSRWA